MVRITTFLVVMLTTVVTGQSQHAPPDDLASVMADVDAAAYSGSGRTLLALRERLVQSQRQQSSRDGGALEQLAIAYTAWRLAFLSEVPGPDRDRALDDAATRLQAVVEVDSRHAEALALLGGVYGAQIGRSPLSAIVLGVRASSVLARAADIAPENPRVLLLQGISALNTPAMFGGGTHTAARLLGRSVDAFAREPPKPQWPTWGRPDAHAWLGQVLVRGGDRHGALAEYDKALAIAPGYQWVRYVLRPAAENRPND